MPTGQLAILLATYRNIGGKIAYVLMGGSSLDSHSAEVHKDAAKLTIQVALQRYPAYQEQQAALLMEPEKAQGELLSPEDFFLPSSFWVSLEEIATFPSFSSEEVELYQNDWNVILHGGLNYTVENYHRAFSYPPYHPHGYDEHEEIWLFPAINRWLFEEEPHLHTRRPSLRDLNRLSFPVLSRVEVAAKQICKQELQKSECNNWALWC